MSSIRQQMRKGTTTVLILKLLVDAEDEPMYGYKIIQQLEKQSGGYFEFQEGLIYPRLHQLEHEGLLQSKWQGEPGTRRRKIYTVTEAGYRRLQEELKQWQRFSATMNQMLDAAPEPAS